MSTQTRKPKYKNLFIVNPNAGTKQAKYHLPKILDMFNENGDINSVHLTEKHGDGMNLAAEYGNSADRIICMGGDGTFSEVITGMKLAGHDIPVGYIPAGTANDFASSLNLSKNMMQAAKDIIGGEPTLLDLGRFGDRYFSYIASFGAFTKVSYSTPQSSKNMLGQFAYIIEAMKELPDIRPTYIKIETDRNQIIEGEYIFGAVSNSKTMGGILNLSPGTVDMSDGVFEVLLIKPLINAKAVCDCVYSLLTQNYESEYITFFKVKSAVIYSDPRMNWSLDGECAAGNDKIDIKNLPCAIKVISK